jgi:hypothetical protein
MNSTEIAALIEPVGGRVMALDELEKIDCAEDRYIVVNTDNSNQVKISFNFL